MRRLLLQFSVVLLLAGSSLNIPANAQGNDGGTPSPAIPQNVIHDPLLCGLFAGVSLNVNNLSQCRLNGSSSSAQHTAQNPPSTTPSPTPARSGTYAALGDSVAAGLGLPQSANATAQDVQCGRSPSAYSTRVGAALQLPTVNLACSGATAGDLFTQQHTNGPNPAAQLNGAFANGTPQLITITAGANDAHWDSFIKSCFASDCTATANQLAARAFLATLGVKLQVLFPDIEARSGNAPPRVLLTGYYNPVSQQCANVQSQITPGEITFLTNETNQLNQVLQSAASQFSSFVTFVPVSFAGHDICSSSPLVQGLNDPAPFHPTAQGQQVIANDILQEMGR